MAHAAAEVLVVQMCLQLSVQVCINFCCGTYATNVCAARTQPFCLSSNGVQPIQYARRLMREQGFYPSGPNSIHQNRVCELRAKEGHYWQKMFPSREKGGGPACTADSWIQAAIGNPLYRTVSTGQAHRLGHCRKEFVRCQCRRRIKELGSSLVLWSSCSTLYIRDESARECSY